MFTPRRDGLCNLHIFVIRKPDFWLWDLSGHGPLEIGRVLRALKYGCIALRIPEGL